MCVYIGYTDLNPDVTSIDFNKFGGLMPAFQKFQGRITKLLCASDFDILRNACITQNSGPGGTNLPPEFLDHIQGISNIRDLINQVIRNGFFTWINVSLVEAMAAASEIPEAFYLVNKYKDFAFQKKLGEILPCTSNQKLQSEYLEKLSLKINKTPDEITVEDLVKYKTVLEEVILDINKGSLHLESISEGCIEVHCLIPIQLISHAYESSLKNRSKLRDLHIRYLHFEGHDRIHSIECSKPDTYFPHCSQKG